MHRDFAYVARDKDTRILKCHVFRCDTPAKAIATSLHEICSKVRWVRAEEFNPLFFFLTAEQGKGCGRTGVSIQVKLWEKHANHQSTPSVVLFLMSAIALNGASPTKGAWPQSLPRSVGLISREVAMCQRRGLPLNLCSSDGCGPGGLQKTRVIVGLVTLEMERGMHSEQSGECQLL